VRRGSNGHFPYIRQRNRVMADLAYILLTVAIFALFGLIVKAVERL
jgi:hypothetical protein